MTHRSLKISIHIVKDLRDRFKIADEGMARSLEIPYTDT